MKSQQLVMFLKRITQSWISYIGKVAIWIICLEDCYVMILYNHRLIMDAHQRRI